MKHYPAYEYTSSSIVLKDTSDLDSLYECILTKEENFILDLPNGSVVIMASPICARLRNGDFILSANNKKE